MEGSLLPAQRQQRILELLQKENLLVLPDLVSSLEISESTLRRDLKELARRGQVRLLRGGGVQLPDSSGELTLETRLQLNSIGKERIARYAARLVYHEDIVFLDASSISYLMIDFLRAERLTVVTNSLPHAQKLLKAGFKCLILGGEVAPNIHACRGPLTEYMLEVLRIGKAFISADGISREQGVTSRDPAAAALKKMVVSHTARSYFMMDASKHNVVTLYQVVSIDTGDVLVDQSHESFSGLSNIRVVSPEIARA